MAKTYYDSAFTGAEIDAAVAAANAILTVSIPENSGKFLSFTETGAPAAVEPPTPEGYDDTALSGRVSALEETVSGLLDATGVSF